MKNSLLLFAVVLLLSGCKENKKEKTDDPARQSPDNPSHLLTKEGIGDLKIGMTKTDIEKLLKQPLAMKHANDTGEVWMDTAAAKYGEIDVEMYFQKHYTTEGEPTNEMELFGVSTGSKLCRTAAGIGVGDDRLAILTAYADNPINMGPENIMINDTTWGLSKTNYYINVSDEKFDKQITFLLINKKVSRLEAVLQMGD
jgi:hypothetical protein